MKTPRGMLEAVERRHRLLPLCLLCFAGLGALAPMARAEAPTSGAKPATSPATSAPATQPIDEGSASLKGMSLEDLMNVEVTSVAKRESTVGDSPAAIYVITQDDIRRTGATSIPEALRMVPGLDVAQTSSNSWNISARGFNSSGNKLLVLVDGRSVYDPLGGNVYWDVQNTVMQDIDRIEVIRGPAGSLWGENAVNGVINITTKSAKETQGVLITAISGTEDRAFGDVRYGWKMGDDAYARVYVKHFERDQTDLPNGAGGSGGDAWQMSQAGFRMDWQPSTDNHYTFHGDIYEGYENDHSSITPGSAPITSDTNESGGNVVGLWEHDLAPGNEMKLQMYYDRTNRSAPDTAPPTAFFKYDLDTFDVDFQHHIHLDAAQDFTWGLGYRLYSESVANTPVLTLLPDHRQFQIVNLFAQYEAELIKDRLHLTLGTKFEHNDFTGFEVQPNARLLLNIDKHQTAWCAVSRAVRAPTLTEEDLHIVIPIPGSPVPLTLEGNRGVTSETVLAYELGYRVEPVDRLSLDVAAYYNVYKHLLSSETPVMTSPLAISEQNDFHGSTYGAEVGATLKVSEWWTMRAAYTYLQMQLLPNPGSTDTTTQPGEGNSPNNQVYLRSSMNLPHDLEFDLMGRYVERLSGFSTPVVGLGGTPNTVPSYISLDARLGWRPNEHLELAVVGQNLLDNQHLEFGGTDRREIPRSFYGMITFRW